MIECPFPNGFLWGAATSAYQIEGAVAEDGRGESIWDRFCREPGRIENGDTADIACDHYHRWREDIALMRRLGLNSYRFSIAWPRVFPTGKGPVNKPGLDFYERLVDGLLAAGIEPLVTVYHWDLPAALQERGGWTNRDTAYRFRDYAGLLFERLGDRVDRWLTINEPYVAAMVGHVLGIHAPGLKDPDAALRAAHHLLLGHGLAVEAFEDVGLGGANRSRGPARIGIALDIHAYSPATDREADLEAAQRAQVLEARWFVEPLLAGRYPQEGLEWYERLGVRPPVKDGDLELISRPIDLLGLNYYRRHVVAHDPARQLFSYHVQVPPGRPATQLDWEVYPEGLYEVLAWLQENYLSHSASDRPPGATPTEPGASGRAAGPAGEGIGESAFRNGGNAGGEAAGDWSRGLRDGHARPARRVAFLITENGAAYPDTVEVAAAPGGGAGDGDDVRIRDERRRDYIALHLHQVWRAVQAGLPVEGYYVWSLMDNFEWAWGYSARFGLVYVDYETQRRIVKDSGHWYARVCQENCLVFDPERMTLRA